VVRQPRFANQFGSWLHYILPFFEQQPLFDRFDLKQRDYPNCSSPSAPGATVIPGFLCPSDFVPKKVISYGSGGSASYFAVNSYFGNGGSRSWDVSAIQNDGVLGINSYVRPTDVIDGLSKTVFAGERHSLDPFFRNTDGSPDELPNRRGWAWANYNASQDVLCGGAAPINFRLSAFANFGSPAASNRLNAFGSDHSGGCLMVFCDGSVRFLTLENTSDLSTLVLYLRRADAQVINNLQ
jgi:prepilin-type processing-associated H-X9-DG protein